MDKKEWNVTSNSFNSEDIIITGDNLLTSLRDNMARIGNLILPKFGGPWKIISLDAEWHHDISGLELTMTAISITGKDKEEEEFIGWIKGVKYADFAQKINIYTVNGVK
jgi:hypothetical protein